MPNVLVVYSSRTGHVREMARVVGEGVESVPGASCRVASVGEADPKSLLDYDAIILGTPTYYGGMSAEMHAFLEETLPLHGRLTGKVGAAFTSSGAVGGGGETAVLDALRALLVHGMIIQGCPAGGVYGPVAVGRAGEKVAAECRGLGKRVAELAARLSEAAS